VARRLLLLLAMFLGFALIGKIRFEVGEDLRAKGLVKSWGHWVVTKKEGVDVISPEVASRYQNVFVFGGLGQRKLQALSNMEGIPVLGPDTFIRKNSFVPIPPARNWGQGPVLEGVLPQGRLS
jgi:hypothetical protein